MEPLGQSTEKAGVGGSKSLPGHHVFNELGEILKPSSTANWRLSQSGHNKGATPMNFSQLNRRLRPRRRE
jgi:hypothetical protein